MQPGRKLPPELALNYRLGAPTTRLTPTSRGIKAQHNPQRLMQCTQNICRTKRLMKSKCVLHPEQSMLTLYWRFMRTFGWQWLFSIQWMVESLSLLMLSSTGRRPQTLMELYKHIFDNLNSNETQDVFEQWTSAVERTGMSTFSNICMSLDKDGR